MNAEYAASSCRIAGHQPEAAPDGAEPACMCWRSGREALDHATDKVTFHGAPARMWQGGSQVQAPVIEDGAHAEARLFARGME